MPLVSVVMSSYNHERYISQSIESVLGQEYEDFELIIVDDASQDASREIIERYGAEEPRIRIIFHEANCGISKTLNDGIEAAKGKFIAYISSDDVWAKEKLTKQLGVLESNEDLIVWAEVEIIDEHGQPIGLTFSELLGSLSAKKSGNIFEEILRGYQPSGLTLLFKRAHLGEIRYDEGLKYVNDWKFLLDLAAEFEFYYMEEPLAQYRLHSNNSWGTRAFEGEKKLVASKDTVLVLEYALSRWHCRISAEAKATALESLGVLYYELGQKRKALISFCRSFICVPFLGSNLRYPRRFFKFAQDILRRESPKRM